MRAETYTAIQAILVADGTVREDERDLVLAACKGEHVTRRSNERPMPRFVTPAQAAEILQVNRRTIWRLVETGRLRKVKLGHRLTRFKLADIEQIR